MLCLKFIFIRETSPAWIASVGLKKNIGTGTCFILLFALWCHFLTMIAPGYFEVSSMKMLSLTPKVMCVMVIVMRAPLSL